MSSLAVSPDTKLVLGLNKYSHDTSICAANAQTGEILFGISKERLTRQKHDSGNVASLVETCLECLDLNQDAIETVVVNNHHHRVLPLEANRAHLEWECGLGINGGAEVGYDDEENLLTGAKRVSSGALVDEHEMDYSVNFLVKYSFLHVYLSSERNVTSLGTCLFGCDTKSIEQRNSRHYGWHGRNISSHAPCRNDQ